MANLSIINNFSVSLFGETFTGKQGAVGDDFSDPEVISVTGPANVQPGTIPTATVRTLWDEDSSFPATWVYFWFWAEATVYLQFVAQATNFKVKVTGEVPFVLSHQTVLGAADTTLMTGGSEPTLSLIDSIAVGNYTGNDVDYKFALFL